MKSMKLSVLFVMLAMMMVMAGCIDNPSTQSGGEGEADAKTNEPEVKEGEEVVHIGYSGPLSGPAAYYGERTLNGLSMAVDEINENGGFEIDGQTYKFNVVALDDKYLPNETAANAKRMLQENDTPIIFSPHSGGIKAMQVFNEEENFLVAAYSSEPDITAAGNELTVRIPPSYDGYLEPFTNYAMENHGKKLAALPAATQYGKDWTEALVPYWEEQGGEVVYNSSIDFTKDTDFFTLVTNALKEDPDVLFIGGPSEPTAKVAKQARELGFEGGFLVMDQAKFDEMKVVTESYDMLNGSVGVLPLVDSDFPGTAEFIEKYEAEHGETPGSEAGYHYVATYIFMEAMKAAGSVDNPEAIRANMQKGLEALPEEKQVYTIVKLDENGGFHTNLRIGVIEEGKVVDLAVE
ncbi:ABC transporter substrate-binding protein [Halobacillus sp. ACCC02827]|uniref:ABC transporter substrate-binding protein n=1 Tax=Halobacillus sp. ACCC02827 TaxID=3052090 RepID=UPI002570BA90|nr:ABC transporter substrate-binding protein [Halobacillus sp. ACCC02827]WJE14983.1 ABC transporter substrate-binding protein [Halobacillus sp. ACCC02827]